MRCFTMCFKCFNVLIFYNFFHCSTCAFDMCLLNYLLTYLLTVGKCRCCDAVYRPSELVRCWWEPRSSGSESSSREGGWVWYSDWQVWWQYWLAVSIPRHCTHQRGLSLLLFMISSSVLIYKQPSRSTQPGRPSEDRHYEYQRRLGRKQSPHVVH